MLDREFDTGALAELRAAVLSYACACGMSRDRAIDVMLAVHELAANAVCHGPGHGRLQVSVTASTLNCQVSDPGPPSSDGRAPDGTRWHDSGAMPWPVEQGHGLWLVHQAADDVRVTSGLRGSVVAAVFMLPAADGRPQPARGPGSSGNAN